MDAEKCLQEENLQEALRQLQDAVRASPADARLRVFLFQLLSVLGDWGRALNQLEVAGELDDGALPMVQTYREALRCEALRGEVFQGRRSPLLFGDPEEWIALVFQALQANAGGDAVKAAALREQAFAAAPTTPGSVDGRSFDWIADADSRIGPFLELILNGNYYWVPFHRIRRIQLEEPEDLRDMVWTPAQMTWANGGQAVALIPTRYPGTEDSGDSALLRSRKTEWQQLSGEEYLGLGQRTLVTDQEDLPLLDIRDIQVRSTEQAPETEFSASAAEVERD